MPPAGSSFGASAGSVRINGLLCSVPTGGWGHSLLRVNTPAGSGAGLTILVTAVTTNLQGFKPNPHLIPSRREPAHGPSMFLPRHFFIGREILLFLSLDPAPWAFSNFYPFTLAS